MNEELKALHKQMLERIDQDDLLEVKKVERYIRLLELDVEYDERLKEEKIVVVTENGQQRFLKSHPLLNEKMKLNNQLIALERTINFVIDALPTSSSSSTVEDTTTSNEGYNPGDLV